MVSRLATSEIVDSVKFGRTFEIDAHAERVKLTKKNAYKDTENRYNDGFENAIVEFDQVHQRAIMRSKSEKISMWLTAIPSIKNQFDLSAREFRDALAIRYWRPLLYIPEFCDGCGHLSHALSCRKGGFIIQRHNEIRDALGDLASQVWSQVRREPVVSCSVLVRCCPKDLIPI